MLVMNKIPTSPIRKNSQGFLENSFCYPTSYCLSELSYWDCFSELSLVNYLFILSLIIFLPCKSDLNHSSLFTISFILSGNSFANYNPFWFSWHRHEICKQICNRSKYMGILIFIKWYVKFNCNYGTDYIEILYRNTPVLVCYDHPIENKYYN